MLKCEKIHNVYIVLGALFGVVWVFLMPPFQIPDEQRHFYRAFMVSEGKVVGVHSKADPNAVGAMLPSSIYDSEQQTGFLRIVGNPNEKESVGSIVHAASIPTRGPLKFTQLNAALVYSPIPYVPQATGILLGRVLQLPLLYLFYLGRLANLTAFLLMTYHSIRLIPKLKWPLILVALMPMTLQQAASLSADALTISSCFLFFSYIWSLSVKPGQLTPRTL